ncbi:hypothetical protein TWF225_008855 [Orbilia oligospora]|nr:hypothetical protein TWF225_008855 [Orbilia oligospora]KAF3243075.1 hypothetical protein TWF128_010300 [Orbilia oligospora]KAF3246057.1 hypothetical protein TWF217_010037 [Orbilia oligospora]
MLERPWDASYVPATAYGAQVRHKVPSTSSHVHVYGAQYPSQAQPSTYNSSSYATSSQYNNNIYSSSSSHQYQVPSLRHSKSQGKSSSGSQFVRRRTRRTMKVLPDDVLAKVFRYASHDSLHYDRKGRSQMIYGRHTLLCLALVSKRFHWIVTPLLYERLEIHPQNEALVRETLIEDPALTKHIHHLRVQMPKRFRTWVMKYSFSPISFELVSNYGTDLDILQHFKIDPYSLKRLHVGDTMSVDSRMCKYIANNFPKLEDITIESPVSFHSQWNSDGLERTVSFFFPLRRLKHLRLHVNMNPSRTANIPPESTWADLVHFLPKVPERLQTLTFGSLGKNEEYVSVSDSLVRCVAYSSNPPSKRKGDKRLNSDGVWSGRGSKWWKIEVPGYLKDRITILERWGVRLKLDELYLY